MTTANGEKMPASELSAALAHFSGSETWYRHSLKRSVIYSEGVKFLADNAGAHWLVDAIASYAGSPVERKAIAKDPRLGELQFWTLTRTVDVATLTCRADSGVAPAILQAIEFTDFPLPAVKVWVAVDGDARRLFLPSEY